MLRLTGVTRRPCLLWGSRTAVDSWVGSGVKRNTTTSEDWLYRSGMAGHFNSARLLNSYRDLTSAAKACLLQARDIENPRNRRPEDELKQAHKYYEAGSDVECTLGWSFMFFYGQGVPKTPKDEPRGYEAAQDSSRC